MKDTQLMTEFDGWYYYPVSKLKPQHLKFLKSKDYIDSLYSVNESCLVIPREARLPQVFLHWHSSYMGEEDRQLSETEVEEIITLMTISDELVNNYVKKYKPQTPPSDEVQDKTDR